MPCSWGVKAGMVRVWVAAKTVIPLLTRLCVSALEMSSSSSSNLSCVHLFFYTNRYFTLLYFRLILQTIVIAQVLSNGGRVLSESKLFITYLAGDSGYSILHWYCQYSLRALHKRTSELR